MSRLLICVLALAGALAALPAAAQRQKSGVPDLNEDNHKGEMARMAQKKAEERFDTADADKDGVLSRAEVAKHLPFIDQNFERYDKNKDGALSWEEFVGHDKWKREAKPK